MKHCGYFSTDNSFIFATSIELFYNINIRQQISDKLK